MPGPFQRTPLARNRTKTPSKYNGELPQFVASFEFNKRLFDKQFFFH